MKAYLEPVEIELLMEAATNLRDKLLVHLLFHIGCRVSEALALTVQDIDLEHKIVTIQHLKSRLRLFCPECKARLSASNSFCSKCGSRVSTTLVQQQEHRRQRMLPLDEDTLKMLRDYIERGGPVTRQGKQLLFAINRHRAWQIIRDCSNKAGLPVLINPESGKTHGVSPHRLRDSFAVHAMKLDDSGDGLRLLQEHLGHQSFNTTAKYRKVAGEEHRAWYEKLWEQNGKHGRR